jgi:hypothetical protein
MGESFCPADADYVIELFVDHVCFGIEFDGHSAAVE